jgi:DNA-binding transcriptional LysR family regulator
MRAMGRAQAQIDDMRGLKGGEISIGIISGLAATLIPLAITQFRTLHPRVKVKVTVATGKEILSQVAEENLDLGLGFNLSRKSRVRLLFSVPSRLGAVVGKKHPLFGRRSIRLTDCIGYPICIADSTMAIHTILSEIFDRSSASITPAVETNSVEIMRRMAADGECITFLSQFETLFDKRSSESLGYIPIIGPQLVDETLMLVGRARNANMHSLRFAEVIKGVMSEISVSADR